MFQQFSDEELMSQVKMGRVDGFETLFTRYRKPLFNFIFRMIGDFHKAQDIFQETFLRVFRHAQRYDESFRFSPWLYHIARNLCLEQIRRQKKVGNILANDESGGQLPELLDRRTPDEELEMMEKERIAAEAIFLLSEKQREVFLLREKGGFSYDEVSQITSMSVSAVKSCLHRARMSLKDMLTPYLESGRTAKRGRMKK